MSIRWQTDPAAAAQDWVKTQDPNNLMPDSVVFLDKYGHLYGGTEGQLTDSHPGSMDHLWTHGAPVIARIIGPAGAVVTFYDDQNFNTKENALTIWLDRDATSTLPLDITLPEPRLGPGDNPNGVYKDPGDHPYEYHWLLWKNAAPNWVAKAYIAAKTFVDAADGIATDAGLSWAQYTTKAKKVVDHLGPVMNTGHSDNSQVDNVSSVRFGRN